MTAMTADEKRRRAQAFSWYHTVDLGDGVLTPGQYDHREVLSHYAIAADLTGKTVLDVGPAHGFFAFEFERRGAARVTTLELPTWSAHDGSRALKAGFEQSAADEQNEAYLHDTLRFAIEARGSRVEQQFGSVYDLDPGTHGTFDVVFCGSMLLHLTDPLRALYAIRSVARDYALVATSIDASRWRRRTPRAVFYGQAHGQTFWAPNMACLERWALAAGFARVDRVSEFRLRTVDGQFDQPHGVIRAWVE
jgi:tRNA (mo5U34)-methyltransferase